MGKRRAMAYETGGEMGGSDQEEEEAEGEAGSDDESEEEEESEEVLLEPSNRSLRPTRRTPSIRGRAQCRWGHVAPHDYTRSTPTPKCGNLRKAPRLNPLNRWLTKQWCVYVWNEICLPQPVPPPSRWGTNLPRATFQHEVAPLFVL